MEIKPIAYIRTDFPEKFGIPRQSGVIPSLKGRVVFEKEYRSLDAIKGLSGFNYIWLLWQFQIPAQKDFQATVRPPRLGGNTRMGVFATRSPFRPNPIGLSSVKLETIEETDDGPVLVVSGVDLKDNTPIFDIKPYIPYADIHEDAVDGFEDLREKRELDVCIADPLLQKLPVEKRQMLKDVLKEDPRPAYQGENREYGLLFAGYNVSFTVENNILTVRAIEPTE